jgi:hypothetical protein
MERLGRIQLFSCVVVLGKECLPWIMHVNPQELILKDDACHYGLKTNNQHASMGF